MKPTKANAWKVFSLWIRNRDKGICFTCGARHWNEELGEFDLQGTNAGHFWHDRLDFDEMNIHCQCVRCNKWLSGNLAVYATRLIDTYGLREFKKLEKRKNRDLAIVKDEKFYKEIIEKYA